MTKVLSKMLTLMLSFAMVFTSIGWLGASDVNADESGEVVDYIQMQADDSSATSKWAQLGTDQYDRAADYVLDVRNDENWGKGHVAGSTHVNVTVADDLEKGANGKDYIKSGSPTAAGLDNAYAAASDAGKKIVIVCNSGNSLAARAMEYFNQKYFEGKGVDLTQITYLKKGAGAIAAEDNVPDFVAMNSKTDKTEWTSWGTDALAPGDYIVDLRSKTSPNYNGSGFSGSWNIPIDVANIDASAEDLDDVYNTADGNRIVLICYSGNKFAANGMNYYYNKYGNVGKDHVTFLIGGAAANLKEELKDQTKARTLGAEKARTMTTNIDMSKYDKGKVVKVWVPVPKTEDYQVISNEKFEAKTATVAKFTEKDGNKMLYLEWDKNADPAGRKATLSFDAKRNEAGHYDLIGYTGKADAYPESVKEYITKESNYVKVNADIVKDYAAEAVSGAEDDGTLAKARAIYDWVIDNLARIDNGEKVGDYVFDVEGCGYGDTVKILTDLKDPSIGIGGGHCTDINSTFVALCRANGIPAREMFGIRMNDDATGGQHCWAEFYLPGTGWVFADPGDVLKAIKPKVPEDKQIDFEAWTAAKDSETRYDKAAYFWGTVDENRIVLSRGRDVTFEPAQSWGPCNTFGYPAAEVDGQKIPDFTDAKNFVYTIACTEVSKEEPAPAPAPAPAVQDGQTAAVNGSTVKVTSASAKTAEYTKAPNKKSVSVPSTVNVNGVTLAVTSIGPKAFTGKKIKTVTVGANVSKIAKNAFKGSKATKMVVKSKKLTKASVKGSLKGSKIKTVQVKVGKKTVNKKYVKKYKKFFTKKNAGKKAKVK